MLYTYEFEVINRDGMFVSMPFGLDGGTQGTSLTDAIKMSADWLFTKAVSELEFGRELPQCGSLGNVPCEGGTVIVVAVSASMHDVESVSAAEAAKRLGVSTARVAQLCQAGSLVSWSIGSTRMVSVASIEYRLELAPQAGRPKED
ncbi:helix-turn-helix domain-containing protein [Collinsella sp. zg1085]|uniref:helix-turn-helix domain-containing protein n=1 Tax=Collinsella sp. zg1085 TaxID=2844380 RepID=UPI001C0AFB08|nr:helix-turn-helix domain-containing protein [Collinsella sp. zg1085]QWT18093.1 helix-turn-helix domain-containing protein [Collinsella sp. zg1085]